MIHSFDDGFVDVNPYRLSAIHERLEKEREEAREAYAYEQDQAQRRARLMSALAKILNQLEDIGLEEIRGAISTSEGHVLYNYETRKWEFNNVPPT